MMRLLAESEGSVPELLLWSAGLIALLVVGMAAAAKLKRRLKVEEDAPAPAAGFTLSDLRQMHRAGQLTDAEFEKARNKVVDAAKKAAERAPVLPNAPVERDSVDVIRARRLAREALEQDAFRAIRPPEDPDQAR